MTTAGENLLQGACKSQQWNYSHGTVRVKSFKHDSQIISSDMLLVSSIIKYHADWPYHSKIIGISTVQEHNGSNTTAMRSNKFSTRNRYEGFQFHTPWLMQQP